MSLIITIFCIYVTIGFILLNTQAPQEQRYINNWLNQAPKKSYKLVAVIIWPAVIVAAALHSE